MNSSVSCHRSDTSDGGRVSKSNRWVALKIALVSLLVASAGAGCRDARPDAPAGLPLATSTPAKTVEPVNKESSGDDQPVAASTPAGSVEPVNMAGPADGVWFLELLDGQPVIEEKVVTLRINGDQIEGIDGCNRYGGPVYAGPKEDRTPVAGTPVASADGVFSAPPLLRTEKGCYLTDHANPEVIMDQGDAYISALMQGERYRLAGDLLEILDSEGVVRLVLVSQALRGRPSNLRGTSWRLVTNDDVASDERMTTMIFDGRQVTGSTACRDYHASYEVSEGRLRFPDTGMRGSAESCSESDRMRSGQFTDFLSWAWEYSVSDEQGSSRLRIRSSRGKTLTFEPLP